MTSLHLNTKGLPSRVCLKSRPLFVRPAYVSLPTPPDIPCFLKQTKSSELSGPGPSSDESVGSDVSDLCDSPRADSPRGHEHSVEVMDSEIEITEVQLLDKPASHVAVGSVRASC